MVIWKPTKSVTIFLIICSAAIAQYLFFYTRGNKMIFSQADSRDVKRIDMTMFEGVMLPTENMSLGSRELAFAARRERISTACQMQPSFSQDRYNSNIKMILVGERKSFIYCAVAKSGSSFWKKALSIIENERNYSSLYQYIKAGQFTSLPTIYEFRGNHTAEEVLDILKNVTTFTFVREPYSRIFSAYNDKLLTTNLHYWKEVGRKVVKRVRVNPPNESLTSGHDVTFVEFIKFLILQLRYDVNIDRHFVPMYERCNPCKMYFDYIGKLETFEDDANFIISKLNRDNVSDYSQLADVNTETAASVAESRVKSLFNIFRRTEFSSLPKYSLFLRTWRHLQIRGFLSKYIPMPFSKTEISNITSADFSNMLKKAIEQSVNTTQLKDQRHEALLQAYRSVPLADLEVLSQYVEPDCILFGYDPKPKWLFDRTQHEASNSFDYFDALKLNF